MAGRMASRRVLITGAASGMGREIARLFTGEGAAPALIDLNGKGVQEVATELGAAGCVTLNLFQGPFPVYNRSPASQQGLRFGCNLPAPDVRHDGC